MPNTFMAVAIDLGDPGSPYGSEHPRDKQDVAARLVRGALNLAQGQDVEYQGPIPEKSTADIENEVVITYKSKSKLKVADRDNFEVISATFSFVKVLIIPFFCHSQGRFKRSQGPGQIKVRGP